MTRRRNIYSIELARGVVRVALIATLLMLVPSTAMAQCRDVGGAGDEYCESLPGPGRDQGAAGGAGGGGGLPPGVSSRTSRELERRGASGVLRVKSPTRAGGKNTAAPTSTAGPRHLDEDANASALPYILAGLTLLLFVAALVRQRRRSASRPDALGPE
jgi:MYXO-CTERM domain-containing protein